MMVQVLKQNKVAFITLAVVLVLFFLFSGVESASATENIGSGSLLVSYAVSALEYVVNKLSAVFFYEIAGFPALVLWLIIGGIFFTVRLGFINIRLFSHAVKVVMGRYSKGDEPGEVTHFQALTAAVSGTVGLGNIAGVAIAVTLGGPGAVIWMVIAGFFGMSTKFAEVTLGQKYRHIDEKGKVSGGAFHYLSNGLKDLNMPRVGKVLAIVFAFCCILGSLGGGNMFQSNQTVMILENSFGIFNEMDWAISLVLAVSVGVVLIGGIRRIAHVAEAIVPFMAFLYIGASIVVIIVNYNNVPNAMITMFEAAFSGQAAVGGVVGAIIAGFKRAAFSNEAGLGSSPIAHAAAKTNEPVREGCVALLEPFVDTVIICFMTGIVITVTGVYQNDTTLNGVILASQSFATVVDWFPKVLAIAVFLFAYSTMITWSYYGERAWQYLFGDKYLGIYHVMFCGATFLGGIMGSKLDVVITMSDLMIFSMAIPNLIGLYLMSNVISRELSQYCYKLKTGKFKVYSKGKEASDLAKAEV